MTRQNLGSEAGFTLIELLVTMVAGIVVLMALFTIMDVALHQTTQTFSLVDATERARPAFEQIENELHSSCFADEETPIQVGSNANALIFLTSSGNAATPAQTWHEIDFASGKLTDSTYASVYSVVSGIPTWSRGAQQGATRTLLNNVSASGTTPAFQYFAYQTAPGTDAGGNQYMILPDGTSPVPGTSTTVYNPLAPGASLSAAQAASAAEVLVTLKVGPQGGYNENTKLSDVGDSVSDSVVFRDTPSANHVGDGAVFEPCD